MSDGAMEHPWTKDWQMVRMRGVEALRSVAVGVEGSLGEGLSGLVLWLWRITSVLLDISPMLLNTKMKLIRKEENGRFIVHS